MAESETESQSPPLGPRQFTLRGLFSFVLAWSVYFALLGSVRSLFVFGDDPNASAHNNPWWPVALAAIVAWIVLWHCYRRWGLRAATAYHRIGPAGALVLAAWVLCLAGERLGNLRGTQELLLLVLAIVAFGCGISTLASFPIAVSMLLCRGLWPTKRPVIEPPEDT